MQVTSVDVGLCRQTEYHHASLLPSLDVLFKHAGLKPHSLRGSQVLLKPNLISATNGTLSCTHATVITTTAQWLIDHGARVRVGDSPAFGSAKAVLRAIGALERLQALGVSIAEFKESQAVTLPSGIQAQLASAALENDILINLPKVKAHSQMRMTLAVKNYFGCLSGFQKPWWHMKFGGPSGCFTDLLLELLSVLPPGLSLVDGIQAMHREGPVHGTPFSLGVLACGRNPVAVDTSLLRILSLSPASCPLWCAAQRAGLPGTDVQALRYSLEHPDVLQTQDFEAPLQLTPVRFNPFRFGRNALRRFWLRVVDR